MPIGAEVGAGFVVAPDLGDGEEVGGDDWGRGGGVGEVGGAGGAAGLGGGGPVGVGGAGGVGGDFGERVAGAIWGIGPWVGVGECEFIHHAVALIDEPEGFAAVGEGACEGAELAGAGGFGDDGVGSGVDDGVWGERVAYAVDAPAGDVGADAELVEDLDPFCGFACACGVVVDLVEDDDGVGGGGGVLEREESGAEAEGERQERWGFHERGRCGWGGKEESAGTPGPAL